MSWNPVFFGLPAPWVCQSRYLHLQASGSDGSDGSIAGHHLRWGLRGNLGAKHLPKGDLASTAQYGTTVAFNKADDYVRIYRILYSPLPATVNFMTMQPVSVDHNTRTWVFECHVFHPVMGDPDDGIFTNVSVRFLDMVDYNANINLAPGPGSSHLPYELMQAYKGIVEIETVGKLCFAVQATYERKVVGYAGSSTYRMEGITCDSTDGNPTSDVMVGLRKSGSVPYVSGGLGSTTTQSYCENLRLIRMDYRDCRLTELRLETYYDQLWYHHVYMALQGEFSLTDVDTDAFGRLNSFSGIGPSSWPRFNGGAKVNTSNYEDRWADPTNNAGIRESVIRYLTLSMNGSNLEALESLTSSTPGDLSTFDLKHLQLLNLMSMDFHIARMLGLGTVMDNDAPNKTYLWVAKYDTLVDEETLASGTTHYHCYMSLPTTRTDARLPVTPDRPSITYGLWVANGTNTPTLITDAHGYLPWAPKRYVNLHKAPFPYDFPSAITGASFFSSSVEFNLGSLSKTVMYGIEYRQDGYSGWPDRELSYDEDYLDGNGIEEALPVPDQPNPIYIHEETEPGIHDYALYAVNIFSRPSQVSQHINTDTTTFAPLQTMVPPLNLSVHYVQEETPPILTTALEQANQLNKTRVTFEWNHINHEAYQPVDKVRLYFRENAALQVTGWVTQVIDLGGSSCEVWTGVMQLTSVSPQQTVQPHLDALDYARFIGATLVVAGESFVVEAVTPNPWASVPGDDPVFRCKKQRDVSVVDPLNDGNFIAIETYVLPAANQGFLVSENLSNNDQGQWHQLAREVDIVTFSGYVETTTESDGSQSQHLYGGIADAVTTTHEGMGVYLLRFSTYILNAHPDTEVEWYRGTCRILLGSNPGDVHLAEVWDIDLGQATLEIRVYAPEFASGNLPASVTVNFHPGYRLYLPWEVGTLFDQGHVEPGTGVGSKFTYMSASAYDSSTNSGSYLHVPAPLMARRIEAPLPPRVPAGPLFATRPDSYGKSTYTFDTEFELEDLQSQARTPYSMLFYRASEQSILDRLYMPSTVVGIQYALKSIQNDLNVHQRWVDLVEFRVEPSGPDAGRFLEHTGYRLPNPDNLRTDAAFDGNTLPGNMLAAVKSAIYGAFLPLTKNPVVYAHLQSGTATSRMEPRLRDANGSLLQPGDVGFDPFPMVRLAAVDQQMHLATVRFTDYSLDGASTHVYFYCAREMSLLQRFGEYSPIWGPISLINTRPPERPEILKLVTQIPNPGTGAAGGVRVEINPYPEIAGVKKFRVYRATDFAKAQHVRTMQEAVESAIGISALDTFSDLTFPPYSETLYYRVVALREVQNEQGAPEWIPSQPSNLVLSSMIDTVNPPAPSITHSVATTLSSPARFQDVTLTWNMTAWNVKYYLYKMNSKGNWNKIYEIKSNDPMDLIYPPQGNFGNPLYQETATLLKEDDDGNPLYHRFKVVAENASGLLTLRDEELTI